MRQIGPRLFSTFGRKRTSAECPAWVRRADRETAHPLRPTSGRPRPVPQRPGCPPLFHSGWKSLAASQRTGSISDWIARVMNGMSRFATVSVGW